LRFVRDAIRPAASYFDVWRDACTWMRTAKSLSMSDALTSLTAMMRRSGYGGAAGDGAGEGARECGERGTGRSLCEEEGDLVLVDGEEEQGRGLAVEVGEVGALEGDVGGEGGGLSEVKTEGETALEPSLTV
jgi:hypothetical protein